ncbi:MAG: hypothetical protein AVDCRST_MAG67-3870, partial [uncultured Solirubrobacteraceae bacterium]
ACQRSIDRREPRGSSAESADRRRRRRPARAARDPARQALRCRRRRRQRRRSDRPRRAAPARCRPRRHADARRWRDQRDERAAPAQPGDGDRRAVRRRVGRHGSRSHRQRCDHVPAQGHPARRARAGPAGRDRRPLHVAAAPADGL